MKVQTKIGKIQIGEGESAVCLVLCDTGNTPIRPTESQQKALKIIADAIREAGIRSTRL